MNKPLFACGSIITTMTAVAIGSVGEVSSCGEVTSWTVPVMIFSSMTIPSVLAYFAGKSHAPATESRTKLLALRDALDSDPDSTSSTYQFAAHYYQLVTSAKSVLDDLLAKRNERADRNG